MRAYSLAFHCGDAMKRLSLTMCLVLIWGTFSPAQVILRRRTIMAAAPSGYSDNFTGANGTALADHNAQWTSLSATYPTTGITIQSNAGQNAAWGNGGAYYAASSADSSQIVYKASTVGGIRVCVRCGTDQLGYAIFFTHSDGSGYWDQMNVNKSGGYMTTISGLYVSQASDHTIKLTFTPADAKLRVYIDTSLVWTSSADGTPLSANHPGFYIGGGASANAVDDWTDQ